MGESNLPHQWYWIVHANGALEALCETCDWDLLGPKDVVLKRTAGHAEYTAAAAAS